MQKMAVHEMSGKVFYFDHGELLVDRTKLPRPILEVDIVADRPYVVQPGDMLITPDMDIYIPDPAQIGEATEVESHLAAFTRTGKLVSLEEEEGNRARRLSELLVAHRVMAKIQPNMRRAEHARRIQAQIGIGHSLRHLLEQNDLVNLYVNELDAEYGVDYRPHREIHAYTQAA